MKTDVLRFTLYSKLVDGARNKKIKDSNNYESLYDRGMKELEKDIERKRDFFIVEHGVRAIKLVL
jgi:hypothetical protein